MICDPLKENYSAFFPLRFKDLQKKAILNLPDSAKRCSKNEGIDL
jgi:hypothetical protein